MEEKKSKKGLVIVIIIVVVVLLLLIGCCCCVGGGFGFKFFMDSRETEIETDILSSISWPEPDLPTQAPPESNTDSETESEGQTASETESKPEESSESIRETESASEIESESESESESVSESESETGSSDGRSADEVYDELALDFFRYYMSDNTINLHFSLKDPSAYGLEDAPVTLGHFSVDYYHEALEDEKEYLKRLNAIDPDKLNDDNQISYEILKRSLETDVEDFDKVLPYMEPLSGIKGFHAVLGTIMASYRLDTKDDVEDYLTLLSQVDEYMDEIITFEDYKMEQGTFMNAEQAKMVAQDCKDVTAPEVKDSTFCTSFVERIEQVDGLTDEEMTAYRQKNETIVRNEIFPAYQELATYMDKMSGKAKSGSLLADSEGGKEYYRYLVKTGVGTDRSVEDIFSLTAQRLQFDYQMMATLYTNETANDMLTATNPLKDPDDIIADLKKKMKEEFPDGDSFGYTVKEIPEDMRSTSAPAYYIVAPIDATPEEADEIFFNPAKSSSNEMYVTMAHEGFPGHLFQTNYFNRVSDDPIRHILDSNGYVEGYAQYVEFQAYEWEDWYQEDTRKLLELDATSTLGIYAYLDIQVNYGGWNRKSAESFLIKMLGNSAADYADDIYDLILKEPANYLNYYVGYLEILELRGEYVKQGHTVKEFNTALLDIGPAPFSVIEEHLLGE